jgi:hypothetical protein
MPSFHLKESWMVKFAGEIILNQSTAIDAFTTIITDLG